MSQCLQVAAQQHRAGWTSSTAMQAGQMSITAQGLTTEQQSQVSQASNENDKERAKLNNYIYTASFKAVWQEFCAALANEIQTA